MIKKTFSSLLLFFCLLLTGCATYHVSTQSLLQQFADTQPEKKTILVAFHVNGNDLKTIRVLDKNGNEVVLPVTTHTGVRITKQDSSRVTFYFNTLQINDSTITGSKAHFFEAHFKPIKLSDIAKIEIQK
jgi:hypothetical protein